MDEKLLKDRMGELLAEREAIDEQISAVGTLLLLSDMSSEPEVRGELLDKLFEKVCR